MAGTLLQTPTNGAGNWTDFITQVEIMKRGGFNIDFTTLADGATAPEIEAGSTIEVNNNIYQFGVQEAATGWGGIANSTIAYMKVVPAGTSITAEFISAVSTYDDLKNGWYVGDDRYVLWLYKDGGGDYTLMTTEPEVTRNFKITGSVFGDVTFNDDITVNSDITVNGNIVISETRYYSPALVGTGTAASFLGRDIEFTGAAQTAYIPIQLPNGAVVTAFYSYAGMTGGSVTVTLERSPRTTAAETTMATNSHVATGALTDSSIGSATIDNTGYQYYAKGFRTTHSNDAHIYGITVTYTITEPLP